MSAALDSTAPNLSVIMPLYNCERWVEEAVRSVLARADGLLELIVVDDGSTDRSAEIVAGIDGPIKLIKQANAGPSAARNAGIETASGEILGFLDSDDIWIAEAPDERRAALRRGADVAFGRIQVLVGDPPEPFKDPSFGVALPGFLIRRSAAHAVGPLDPALTHGEDADWVLRMKERGLVSAHVDQVAYSYRLRPGSLISDRAANRPAIVHRLKESLERRGKLSGGGP